jgi:transcriptional regulator with XRE-family HTH domain
LGLTQAQLAECLEVDSETISRFERGKHLPPLLTLERLADILKLPLSVLLQEEPTTLPQGLAHLNRLYEDLNLADRRLVFNTLKTLALHLANKRATQNAKLTRPSATRLSRQTAGGSHSKRTESSPRTPPKSRR